MIFLDSLINNEIILKAIGYAFVTLITLLGAMAAILIGIVSYYWKEYKINQANYFREYRDQQETTNEELANKGDQVMRSLQMFIDEVVQMRKDVLRMQGDVTSIKENVSSIKTHIGFLEKRVDKSESHIDDLKNKIR